MEQTISCLTRDGFQPVQLKHAPAYDPNLRSALLRDGDILISRSNGSRELVGLPGRYRDLGVPCIYSDLMMRIEPIDEVLPEFLETVLRHSLVRRQLINASCGTSTMWKITSKMVINTVIVRPEKDEQKEILRRGEDINSSLSQFNHELASLKCIKIGLMQDLLTGKVRVKVGDAEEGGTHA
jgi:type I restriction enzyme S subunit